MRHLAFLFGTLAVTVAVLPASAYAGSMIGISVGEPLAQVPAKLRSYGTVTELNENVGTGYMAGDYVVVGCRGRVWGVSRTLSAAFRSFVAASKKIELELGAAPTAKIVSDDGAQELSMINFQWDLGDGSLRTMMYVEGRQGSSSTEGIRQKTTCSASAR